MLLLLAEAFPSTFEQLKEVSSFAILLSILIALLAMCFRIAPRWIEKEGERRDSTLKALRDEMAVERARCDAQLMAERVRADAQVAAERERSDEQLRLYNDNSERRFQALMGHMERQNETLRRVESNTTR